MWLNQPAPPLEYLHAPVLAAPEIHPQASTLEEPLALEALPRRAALQQFRIGDAVLVAFSSHATSWPTKMDSRAHSKELLRDK